jgi:2-keto-4-pentenoate hydratase/2-oxohepta-3-ene-1,7-dioic acid hydratase in catechol pathway
MGTITFIDQSLTPGKIVCIGKNYVAHIEEMGSAIPDDMVVFMKPASSIGDTLVAYRDEAIHFEGEICLLMGEQGVAGVGFGLDLTKRASQAKLKAAGLPWERSKAFDGAALFSSFVSAPADLQTLRLELHIDGQIRQQGGSDLMMYPPAIILSDLAKFVELAPGDIVMTGTPAGVGAVEAGQHFVGKVFAGDTELVSAEWLAS